MKVTWLQSDVFFQASTNLSWTERTKTTELQHTWWVQNNKNATCSVWFSVLDKTERSDRLSLLLQGVLKQKNSPRLCDGSHRQVGRSHPEEWCTSSKMVLCKSTTPDSTTFTPGWSWPSRTVPLRPRLSTRCLWRERDAPRLWTWWRPTEQVSALISRDAPGPQTVTSAPPCSCRNTTGFSSMCRTPLILVMLIMPTSSVSTRSEELQVIGFLLCILVVPKMSQAGVNLIHAEGDNNCTEQHNMKWSVMLKPRENITHALCCQL